MTSDHDDAPGGPDNGRRTVMRNLGWMLGSRGLQAVLSLVYLGIATRTLGVGGFGRFALITGASLALITVIGFPTWQIVIQFGVSHITDRDDAALGRLLRACGLLDLCAAAIGCVAVFLIVGLFGGYLGIGPDMVGYVLAFAVIQLLALRSTALGILRLRNRYSYAAWADSATPILRFVGAILAWAVLPTVGGFLIAWAVAEILTSIVFWTFTARTGDLTLMINARIDRTTFASENPHFFRFAFSSSANGTLGLSERQIPLLLVGAFVGPAAAGGFRLAFQLAQALSKIAQIVTRAAFPELVRAVRNAPGDRINRMLVRILLASTAVAVPILIAVLAAGGRLLALIGGNSYRSAYPILIWLAAAGCLDLATVAFEPVLLALHRAGTAFIARFVSTLVIVAATLALIPHYGATGAAIGILAGSIVTEFLVAFATFRAVARMPAGAMLDRAAFAKKKHRS